jgi:hypothetical protein
MRLSPSARKQIRDNREAHGNTPIVGEPGAFERLSVVAYFHASNQRRDMSA